MNQNLSSLKPGLIHLGTIDTYKHELSYQKNVMSLLNILIFLMGAIPMF